MDEHDNLLSGAVLRLLDSDSNIIDEWETTDEEHLIYLAPGRYVLQEIKAPNGYLLADELVFKVVANEENTITMENKPISLLAITCGNGTSVSVFIAILFGIIMGITIYIGKKKSN